jgi:hypothetical protein
LYGGKLIDTAVIFSMELIVGDDPLNELQSGATVLDECGNLSKIKYFPTKYTIVLIVEGMDECDTAAVMFDCGKNKAPAMITNMIMAAELNSTAVCEHFIFLLVSMSK